MYGIIKGVHRVVTKGTSEMKSGSRDAEMTKTTPSEKVKDNWTLRYQTLGMI